MGTRIGAAVFEPDAGKKGGDQLGRCFWSNSGVKKKAKIGNECRQKKRMVGGAKGTHRSRGCRAMAEVG